MQNNFQVLSDNLESNIPEMLRRFQKQIGQDAIEEYREAEQEYRDLAEKFKQSDLPFETKEDISDIEFCICHQYAIQNVLCYLQGVRDGQKTK